MHVRRDPSNSWPTPWADSPCSSTTTTRRSAHTSLLGFEVVHDEEAPPHRFAHLALSGRAQVGLWLWKATAENAELVGVQFGGRPLLVIYTDDCAAEYERLNGLDVRTRREPKPEGSAVCFLAAELYGNEFVVVELRGGS